MFETTLPYKPTITHRPDTSSLAHTDTNADVQDQHVDTDETPPLQSAIPIEPDPPLQTPPQPHVINDHPMITRAKDIIPPEDTGGPLENPKIERRSFHGGPKDMYVLRELHLENDYIWDVMQRSGLEPLMSYNYRMVDKGILSTFAERWHKYTSSFHLSYGEMMITFDDVSSLLHILVGGDFFTLPMMSRDLAIIMLVNLLGVTLADAYMEMNACRGAHILFSWLWEVYQK
ncbi:putative serine/threonine-protein phosphatase 7 long form-like protein, partial [Sesbania bispinosa]